VTVSLRASLQQLRDHVRSHALNRPGIYRMLAPSGVVIYVGKSKRVRTRLMGYFRARSAEKGWRIVREAASIDWEYTPSEFASLLRELQLIKRFRPPYNVMQKRDGLYSFLKVTRGPAPKLHVVRRVTGEPGTYFGPFRGGQRIVEAVRELNDAMLLRGCRSSIRIRFSDQVDLFAVDVSPLCPRFELRRCAGPCAGLCSEREYGNRVEQAKRFLYGDADEPLQELRSRMDAAAGRWEFEHAAALRNRIARLEMLREEFRRLREGVEGLSFLYAVPGADGDHRIYAIRSGSIRGVYAPASTPGERRKLLEEVEEHYDLPEGPADVTSRNRVEEILLVSHWFRTRRAEHGRTYPRERWNELPLRADLEQAGVA
jgi:excinuclease ABC subunit C